MSFRKYFARSEAFHLRCLEGMFIKKGHLVKKTGSGLVWWSGILVLILLTGSTAALERMPVERLDLQAKLLRAVLKFSSRQLEQLVVGVIYVEEAKAIAQNFAAELEKLRENDQPIQVVFIAANTLETVTDSVNVVYVTPGNEAFLDTIVELTSKKNILSCSGIPEYVLKNKIALGFGEYQGKPQIILSLPVAKSAGHEFKNPKFLNLQTTRKLMLIK